MTDVYRIVARTGRGPAYLFVGPTANNENLHAASVLYHADGDQLLKTFISQASSADAKDQATSWIKARLFSDFTESLERQA